MSKPNEVEVHGDPLTQLYTLCINHLIQSDYKFKLVYEHDSQVVIELKNGKSVDFFNNKTITKNE